MDTLYRQLIQTEVCAKNRMEINMQKNIFYNMLKKNAELYSDNIAVLYDTMEITFKKLLTIHGKKQYIYKDSRERELPYMVLHHIDG